MCRVWLAWVKLPSLATATKTFNWCRVMDCVLLALLPAGCGRSATPAAIFHRWHSQGEGAYDLAESLKEHKRNAI
jgi:hypothetical protein